MSKVSLKSKDNIYCYDVDIFVNKNNNEISYVEKDDYKTFVSYDYKNNILKRDNNIMYMEFDFGHEKGYILEKNINKKFYMDICVGSVGITSHSIEIEYSSNGEFYEYSIFEK